MKSEKQNKKILLRKKHEKLKRERGITLIALVITIIVLLILAGVSIAMLTGENGILTKVGDARTKNEIAEEKEQMALAYNATLADNEGSGVTAGQLEDELQKYDSKITVEEEGENFQVTFPSGNTYTLKKNGTTEGSVAGGTTTPPTEKSTLEQAKDAKTIFDKKTTLEDKYGNTVVVPEDFKIAEDSATDVTGGVVIEDASSDATAGSQFVWIPVGEVKKGTETKNIKLSRYTFSDGNDDNAKGTPIEQGSAGIPVPYMVGSKLVTETLTKNGSTDKGYNEVADKDVYDAFAEKTEDENTKTKVEKTGGYYIGRYEARTPSPLSDETKDDIPSPQLTEKANDSVYNFVTQPQASKLCKSMYQRKTYKSDLMNSYAWDTAIVFLQTFDDREEQGTPYSYQNSLNTGELATMGTNNLEANKDKICNIWDMASNCYESTTETCEHPYAPCIYRGGHFKGEVNGACFRGMNLADLGSEYESFRPLLVV